MNNLVNWQAIHQLNQAASFPGKKLDKEETNKMWSRVSKIYDFMSRLEKKYTLKQVNSLILNESDTVLDVGCGIGRLTVPIAKKVSKVTALDIADEMLHVCKKNVEEAGLENVTIINSDWNEIEIDKDIAKHDVAFSSRSVGLYDIIKLNNVAKKYAYLLSFSQYPTLRDVQMEMLTNINDIKKREVDHVKQRMFGYNVIFNMLYDLGIDPMVKVVEDGFEKFYESKEDAYNDLKYVTVELGDDYELSPEEEEIFQRNIDQYLTFEDGKYRFLRTTKTFIIGWEPIKLS